MDLLKIELADFGNLFRTDPSKLTDQELLSLDFILHKAWKQKRDGGDVHFGDKSWSYEDLVNLHTLVRQEMSRRAFKHTIADELDDQTQPFLKGSDELAPVYPSGVELGRPVTLDEVLPQIKSFYPNPIFAWIVGGLANWGKTKGDIDVLWWAPPEFPGYLKKILEVRFGRQFKDPEIAGRVQHHLNIFQGPFSKAVPVYALKVERINPQGDIKEASLSSVMEINIDSDSVDLVWDDLKKGWTIPESWLEKMHSLARETIGLADQPPPPSDISMPQAEESEKSDSVFEGKEITIDGDGLLKGVRQAFGSYGGKRALAHKIASFIPHHRTYVEPFAGGAAVLFAKDYSPKEVLNDRDSEIAFMYRFIKNHTLEDRQALAKRDWVIRKDVHERLKKMKPETDRDRFYKSYYLTRSSYGKQRGGSFNPANAGVKIDFQKNIERSQGRLHNVTVYNKDYLDILKEYDGEDTFFYMDPPYPDTFNLFDLGFEEKEFLKALKKLKAKWIVSYPVHKAGVLKGFNVIRVKRRNQMRGPGGNQEWITEIMASNFPLEPLHLYIDKDLTAEPEGMEPDAALLFPQTEMEEDDDIEKIQGAFKSPGGKFRLCKKLVPLFPEHKTFVEGFCGGAQVFFHKKRSDEEVLNDVNPDLIFAYRFIKSMGKKDHAWLEKQYWTISRTHVKKVFDHKPTSARERFYRIAYLNKANYWGRTDRIEGMRTGEKGEGYKIQLVKRLPQIKERLQGVKLLSKDWTEIIKTFDSPDTFFYLDPPYPLHWPKEGGRVGPKFFKEEDLMPTLRKIKGRFLMSYELEKAKLFKGFKTYRVKTTWTGANQLGHRNKFELLVSNYPVKANDLYVEKSLEPLSLEPILKQDDIFDINPPEDKIYQYVMQHHWRGKTVHVDYRIESMDKNFVIGWTLADLIEGVVNDPVESLDAAKKWSEDGSAFKIDFKTGRFKDRQTRSDNVVPAQLRAFPKAKEPHIWIDVEGQTDPFPAPGSTRQFRGVFLIEDKGECEYGVQKLDAHEYFLNGKLKGRLLIRRLSKEAMQESDLKTTVLPPGKIDEGPVTDTTWWVAIQPINQTPIVLSDREVENAWIPPFGISALPKAVRDLIPDKYQYWKIQDRAQALGVRNALVDALKNEEVKIDFNQIISGESVR